MKEQILAQLNETHRTIGFNEKTFGAVADYLSAAVTDESGIQAALTAFAPLMNIFQGEVDRVRTLKANEISELKAKYETRPLQVSGEGAEGSPAGTSKEFAAMLHVLREMGEEIKLLKTSRVVEARQSKFDAVLQNASPAIKMSFSDKDVAQFETDEDFEKFLGKVSGIVEYEKTEALKQGLVTTLPASGGKVVFEKKNQASPEQIEELAIHMGLRQPQIKI